MLGFDLVASVVRLRYAARLGCYGRDEWFDFTEELDAAAVIEVSRAWKLQILQEGSKTECLATIIQASCVYGLWHS